VFTAPKQPPPLSAEFSSTLEHPGATEAKQIPFKLFRSSDGKTHVDQGNQSVITDPAAGKAILLDHVKKEAQIFPLQAPGQKPQMQTGGAPQPPQPPQSPLNVKDLGKRMLLGHEVEGKSYTYPPLEMPKSAPQAPQASQAPQAPQARQAPGAPQAPQPPQVMEVWTSPKLLLPLATRVTGAMGKQTTMCKRLVPGEPPASAFQIPPDYKVIQPHAPTPQS